MAPLALLFALSAAALPEPPVAPHPFTLVLIDAATERRLGPFPYDREVYARAARKLKDHGAKAVVMKIFLDQPKSEKGDAALEAALAELPAFHQARLDDEEPSPNPLPDRFALTKASGRFTDALSGKAGWLPLPRFTHMAAGLGFVDVADPGPPFVVPMALLYQGRLVPSLWLSVLERAFGEKAKLTDKELRLGKLRLPLDAGATIKVEAPESPVMETYSFAALLDGSAPASRFKDRIVVLGYDGDKQGLFETPAGPMKAHRLFYHVLVRLYARLEASAR